MYTCHASEDKLLVIADLDEGSYLRMPCKLSGEDPLRHFRYAYSQVFGDSYD